MILLIIILSVVIPPAAIVAFFIHKKLEQNGNRYAMAISLFSFLITGAAIAIAGFAAFIYLGGFTR
jgi:hypothetical protein